jgi:hypothetical protein
MHSCNIYSDSAGTRTRGLDGGEEYSAETLDGRLILFLPIQILPVLLTMQQMNFHHARRFPGVSLYHILLPCQAAERARPRLTRRQARLPIRVAGPSPTNSRPQLAWAIFPTSGPPSG